MGQPKLLLPWHGVPLIRHVVQQALRSQLDQIVVVVGHDAEHVHAAVSDLPTTVVYNKAFLEGQSTSLKAGIDVLSPEVAAVVVLLADQPLLQPTTIDHLIEMYHARRAPIVVPRYDGQRGNPVLFDRSLFGELQTIGGDQGARSIMYAHMQRIAWLDVDDQGVVLDLDTPDMYKQLLTLADKAEQ